MKTYLIAFLDVIFCALIIVLFMITPPQDKDILKPPGSLMVMTTWPDIKDKDDVDTWMFAPGMTKPIGYDNKASENCDLVKDDLGVYNDSIGLNFENIFCRDSKDGEYIINLHGFSITGPTTVQVQIVSNLNGVTKILFEETVTLNGPKDEQTVIRFKLKDGKLVPGSVHHTFVSLYKK